jgi:hypothetical protein
MYQVEPKCPKANRLNRFHVRAMSACRKNPCLVDPTKG